MTTTNDVEHDPTGTFAVSHDDAPNHHRVEPPARPATGQQPAPRRAGRPAPTTGPAPAPAPTTGPTPADQPAAVPTDDQDDDEPEWIVDDEEDDEPTGRGAMWTGVTIAATAAGLVVFHFFGPIVLVASAAGGAALYVGGRQVAAGGTPEGTRAARRAARNGRATTPGRAAGGSGGRHRRGGGLSLPKIGGSNRRGGAGRTGLLAGGTGRAAKAAKSAAKGRTGGARAGGLPKAAKGRAGSVLPKLRAGGPKASTGRKASGLMPKLGGRGRGGIGLPRFGGRSAGRSGPRSRMMAAHSGPAGTRKAPGKTTRARGNAPTKTAHGSRPLTLRELYARARANAAARRAARQEFYLSTYWPQLGRELHQAARTVGRHLVRRPATWVGRTFLARPARSVARRARIRARWARAYLAPAMWQQFLRRAVPVWMHRLHAIARRHGFRRALVASLVAAVTAVATFLRETAPGWVWQTDDQPTTPARRHVVKPVVDRHDDEQDSDAPLGVNPVEPQTTPRPAPAARPRMATTTRTRRPITPADTRPATPNPYGGTVTTHPALTPITEASFQQVALFAPRSIPDLHSYLNSQADAMLEREEVYHLFADKLAATFPGAIDIRDFLHDIGTGYRGLAAQAVDLYQAYRDLHKADIDRHERPRVNEHRADLIKRGATRSAMGNPQPTHPQHLRLNEVLRTYVLGYDPGAAYCAVEDDVQDLIMYLAAQPHAFLEQSQHARTFAENLVANHPVDTDVHAYYWQFAHGYAHLADRGSQLAEAYLNVNSHDAMRRLQPRTNETWADFGNQDMTV